MPNCNKAHSHRTPMVRSGSRSHSVSVSVTVRCSTPSPNQACTRLGTHLILPPRVTGLSQQRLLTDPRPARCATVQRQQQQQGARPAHGCLHGWPHRARYRATAAARGAMHARGGRRAAGRRTAPARGWGCVRCAGGSAELCPAASPSQCHLAPACRWMHSAFQVCHMHTGYSCRPGCSVYSFT